MMTARYLSAGILSYSCESLVAWKVLPGGYSKYFYHLGLAFWFSASELN